MNFILEPIKRFFRHSFYSYKALFNWLDPKVYILAKIATPIFQLLFFCVVQRYANHAVDISFYIISNSILLCVYNSIFGVVTVVVDERSFGTLKVIIVTPYNKFLLFIGRAFMHIFDALFTVSIGLIAGMLIFGLNISHINFSYFIVGIFLAIFSTTGFGLLLASIGLITRDLNLLMNLVVGCLLTLTGANFPVERLPFALQKVSLILPTSRIIRAISCMLNCTDVSVNSLFFQEFIIGTIYIILGYFTLIVMEKIANVEGTLDIY